MSFSRRIELDDFSIGLITDLESAKLPKAAASRLQNANIKNGFLETMAGVAEVNTGLPAGFVKLSEEQIKFTTPTEQNVVLVHGTLAGVHKLYVRPYLSLAGAWVDAWQDLTEREGRYTADATTSGAQIVDSELLSTVDDYYKHWIVYNATRRASAIVTAYNGTTKTLTLSWVIQDTAGSPQTAGDIYELFRNPIYSTDDIESPTGLDSLFKATQVRFLARTDAVSIITGSDNAYGIVTSSNIGATDLSLTVINNRAAFNDSDLTYTGLYLTRKPPATIKSGGDGANGRIMNCTAIAATPVDALAAGDYIVFLVPLYDGFQEGAIDPGIREYDGTTYEHPSTSLTAFNVVTIGANQKIQIAISIHYSHYSSGKVVQFLRMRDPSSLGYYQDFLIFDRRITALRIYAASINTAGKLTSKIRYIKELAVDSTAWSGGGPTYTQTVTITKPEYDANDEISIEDRQGHLSLRIYANADFIATAKKRTAVASVYVDQQRKSFVFFSALNSDGFNTPDVIPHTSFLDLSLYGIPKLVGFVEGLGFYVAIGENQLVKIDAATLSVDKNTQARGASSPNAVISANGLIYFVNLEDIYYYHPSQDVIRSIATGFIREAWRALPTADKQAAAIGYDRRFEKLVIAAGATIYTYNLPAAYASDLASDTQAIGSWEIYSVGKTFIRFYTDLAGRCIGIANDGKSYELFSSGVANTMIYEKVLGEGNLNLHTLRLTYEASATVTVRIFDMARNTMYPLKTYNFPMQMSHKRYDQHKGCAVRRLKLQISAPVGTKISRIDINPQPLADEK